MKKITVLILSIMLAITLIPSFAFATEEANNDDGITTEAVTGECSSVSISGTDTTAPVCTGITVRNRSIVKPDYLTVDISFDENGTGIYSFTVWVVKKGSDQQLGNDWAEFHYYVDEGYWSVLSCVGDHSGTKNYEGSFLPKRKLFSETVTCSIYVGDYLDADDYYVCNIDMVDAAGNDGMCSSEDSKDKQPGEVIKYKNEKNVAGQGYDVETGFESNTWFSVHDEFDFELEESLSNPNIRNDVKTITDGKSMKLLADSSTVIPKEAFDAIKGKDSRIVAYNDKYQWIFYGKNITKATKDVNVAVTYKQVDWSAYNTNEAACVLQFKNNGVLPGVAEVRIASDYAYDLYNAKHGLLLYFILNNTPQLQNDANIKARLQYDKKWCTFEISHNSDYLLSGSAVNSNNNMQKDAEEKAAAERTEAEARYAASVEVARQGVYDKALPKVKISKPTSKKKTITAKWTKLTKKQLKKSKATHYEIWICPNSGFAKAYTIEKIVGKKKASCKFSGLNKNTKYYVRVRAIKFVNGEKHVGKWSQKAIKTKKK